MSVCVCVCVRARVRMRVCNMSMIPFYQEVYESCLEKINRDDESASLIKSVSMFAISTLHAPIFS